MGDVPAWVAAVVALGSMAVAIVAAVFSSRQVAAAKTQAAAALQQADEAKRARKAAEAGVEQAQRSAKAAEESATQSQKANEYASEQVALMRADREDRERQEQRDMVIEVLRTGRSYARILEMMVLSMGKARSYAQIVDTDSWNTYTQARETYDKVRLHARYAVKAPEVAAVIRDLESVGVQLSARTDRLMRIRGESPMDDVLSALEIPRGINYLLDRLEELADWHFKESGREA